MPLQVRYRQASGSLPNGVIGGIPVGDLADALELDALDLSTNLQSPAEGDGFLWVYSKHYANITEFDGETDAINVGMTVLNSLYPDQIFVAAALTHDEALVGGSHHYGAQTGLLWTEAEPNFSQVQGWGNTILLTNGSGDPGHIVSVNTSTGNSLGFWIARRFSENYDFDGITGTNLFTLGFNAESA